MSSSVFFKFKSQKEPTRVEFDGTGISVFELKRDIIHKSGLGDGTDFDLFIYTDDNSEEYDDDTTIIPRSTTVIARRQPAMKPGAGRAARYVSGKAPITAKNAGRKEQAAKAAGSKTSSSAISQMNSAMTEEDKMAAMFAAQSEQWSAQQEEMSHQTPVFKPGAKRPANVPDHDPPTGYICYRCGQKGHWIQLCPTNDDPEFDNRPRVKRTTGIPRSFLQKVDKSVVLAQSEGDDTKRPSGVMVNADGDFVIAEPDKASWEQYQAKAKTTSGTSASATEDKEVQERGLQCSIDKKMFIDPMKTPCCQKTFCNDCITNALMDSDFVCPACQTDGVLLDDLQPDEAATKKIQEYNKEKEEAKEAAKKAAEEAEEVKNAKPAPPDAKGEEVEGTTKVKTEKDDGAENVKPEDASAVKHETTKSPVKEEAKSPSVQSPSAKSAAAATGEASVEANAKSDEDEKSDSKSLQESNTSKKRPADDFLENPKIPKGPKAMQNQQQQQQQSNGMPNMMNGMPDMGMNNMMFNGMGMMPNMMGMPGMPMGMPMMPNMMGMPGFNGMNGGFGEMSGWDMNPMAGNMGMNMGMNMGNMNGMNGNGPNGPNGGGGNMQGGNMQGGGGMNGFPNRFNFTQPNQDDDAYFRKPVNPGRHQNRGRKTRPTDYREL